MSITGNIKPRLLKLGAQFKHELHTYTWCVLKEVLFNFWASTALNLDPFWLHVQPLHLQTVPVYVHTDGYPSSWSTKGRVNREQLITPPMLDDTIT